VALPDLVTVTVAPDSGDALKITWSWRGFAFPPYRLDAGLLRRLSVQVRQRLKDLVGHAMGNGANNSGAHLKALAEAGSLLHQALFLSEAGPVPGDVSSWLRTVPAPCRIVFSVDARVHIPWGLVYDADPQRLSATPGDTEIQRYEDFWCLKYSVATVYVRITPKGLLPRIGHNLEVISVINRDALIQASRDLPNATQIIDRLRPFWGNPVHTSHDFFERWARVGGSHALIYFFCHANGTRLAVGTGDEIHVDTLRLKLQRSDPAALDSPSIVFLNGCATAVGDPSGGFLEATGNPRFCGFVGAESVIPDIFGLRFGAAFLEDFLSSGETVAQIMHRLRRVHWPLSVLYSINCYPEFRAEPASSQMTAPPAEPANRSRSENYSLGPLGSREL
jgi:hypothetical protein